MTDITKLNVDTSPFTIRKPRLSITHLAILSLFMCFVLFIISASENWLLRLSFYVILSFVFSAMIYLLQNRSTDEKTATEFQALAFSGSMRCNNFLNVILYQDGSIFYLDPRYPLNFDKGSAGHNLDQFLAIIGVPSSERTHVYDSVRNLDKATIEYTYTTAEEKVIPLKITITPLARPSGFVNLSVTEA
jgi:hypothetical protein